MIFRGILFFVASTVAIQTVMMLKKLHSTLSRIENVAKGAEVTINHIEFKVVESLDILDSLVLEATDSISEITPEAIGTVQKLGDTLHHIDDVCDTIELVPLKEGVKNLIKKPFFCFGGKKEETPKQVKTIHIHSKPRTKTNKKDQILLDNANSMKVTPGVSTGVTGTSDVGADVSVGTGVTAGITGANSGVCVENKPKILDPIVEESVEI